MRYCSILRVKEVIVQYREDIWFELGTVAALYSGFKEGYLVTDKIFTISCLSL